MRRVIFLDIDGVLSCKKWRKANPFALRWECWKSQIDPVRLDRFDGILLEFNRSQLPIEERPIVVLASTWRFHWTLSEMTKLLAEAKRESDSPDDPLQFELHSTTPIERKGRLDGIYAWFETHGEPDLWIVLDDDPQCAECGDHWIEVADGLESRHVTEAFEKLGHSK